MIMIIVELYGDMLIFVVGDSVGVNIVVMVIFELLRFDREKLMVFILIYGVYLFYMNFLLYKLFKDGIYGFLK